MYKSCTFFLCCKISLHICQCFVLTADPLCHCDSVKVICFSWISIFSSLVYPWYLELARVLVFKEMCLKCVILLEDVNHSEYKNAHVTDTVYTFSGSKLPRLPQPDTVYFIHNVFVVLSGLVIVSLSPLLINP